MSTAKILALAALAAAFACRPAWAQAEARQAPLAVPGAELQGTVTLRAALEAAWQRAVVARESDGQRRRAEAGQIAASSYWAAPPSLELAVRNDRWMTDAGERETTVGVAWPLLLPGQRTARTKVADGDVALADDALAAAQLRLAGEVREAAWSLADQRAEVALADAQVKTLEALADDVDRRVRAGDLARVDALAARAEWLNATTQRSEVQQRWLAALSRWTTLTGLETLPAVEVETARAASTDPLAAHPEVRLSLASTEQARRRLDLLRSSRRDAPELTMGVRQDIPSRGEPANYSLLVGVRVPFGPADRNRPLEASAIADLDTAETVQLRLRERLTADIALARERAHQAERQLQAERERAALLRERAQLIDKSFRAGESSLPDLLRALSASAHADAALARQQALLGLARARFNQSLGLLP